MLQSFKLQKTYSQMLTLTPMLTISTITTN